MTARRFKLIKRGALEDGTVLDDLADVDSGSATNGKVLIWNGTTWVPGDHGDIAGLADDDHPQYPLHASTETISGQWTWSVPLRLADGTAALPSLTFGSDPGLGMLRVAVNILGLAANGILSAQLAENIFTVLGTTPRIRIFDSDAAADGKYTEFDGNSGFKLQFLNDSASGDTDVLSIARSGTVPGAWALTGTGWTFSAGLTTLSLPTSGATLSVIQRTDTAIGTLFAGGTKGIRVSFTDSTEGRLEGVDNTGVASHQPLGIGGSQVNFRTSGALRASLLSTSFDLSGDNYELRIGASNDLRLYHDGTNTFIRNDLGRLQFLGTGSTDALLTLLSAGALASASGDVRALSRIPANTATRFQTDPTNTTHAESSFLDSIALEISRGSSAGFVSGIFIAPRSTTSPAGEGVGLYGRSVRLLEVGNQLVRSFANVVEIENTNPFLLFDETDAAADERRWAFEIQAGGFLFKTQNDAVSVARTIIGVERTGAAVDQIRLGNSTDLTPVQVLGHLQPAEVAAPSTPPSGFGAIYAKTDGLLYFKNDAGTEYDLTATGAGLGDGDKGDITVSGAGTVWTIDNNVVTYAKMQDVSATSRFLGRITAGAGDTEELTGTQATTLLDVFTSGLKGLAPASGGGTTNFLRADGTWASPSSSIDHGTLTGLGDDDHPQYGHLAQNEIVTGNWNFNVQANDISVVKIGESSTLRGGGQRARIDMWTEHSSVFEGLFITLDNQSVDVSEQNVAALDWTFGLKAVRFNGSVQSRYAQVGSHVIETGRYGIQGKRLELTTTQRLTIQGTGRLSVNN